MPTLITANFADRLERIAGELREMSDSARRCDEDSEVRNVLEETQLVVQAAVAKLRKLS